MSANSKKTTTKGKRYTDAEKQEVISFVGKVNAEKGRGGQSAAAEKYNISVMTVASWLKAGAALKPATANATATTAAVKPATAATVAAKPAKATKAAVKPAKAVKAVAEPAKAIKATKATKGAAKPAKKTGKKGVVQRKRYTDEQKQEVVDFVIAVNASKGRGGLSAATQKFGISPISISSWAKKSGVKSAKPPVSAKPAKPAKPAKAVKALPAKSGLSATSIVALGSQIAKAEAELAKLKVMIRTLK